MDHLNLIYEVIMNKLPKDVKDKIGKQSVRNNMSNDSFLLPGEKKFPIKKPGSNQYDCKLLYAAYIRAKQWSEKKPQYEKVAANAKRLLKLNKCPSKLNLKLEEEFIKDEKLMGVLEILESEISKNDKEDLNTCVCPKCGTITTLDIDDTICEEKNCPKCSSKMTDSTFESEFISDGLKERNTWTAKMKFLVDHNLGKDIGKPGDQFLCIECKTVLEFDVKENEKGACPKCGTHLRLLKEEEEYIAEEKRNICPKCKTSTVYSIRENDCPVCESKMVTFAKLNIKQDKALPFSD